MKTMLRISVVPLAAALYLLTTSAWGQTTNDYRSNVASGNWGTAGSWQRFDGSTWVAASSAPTSSANVITIRNGHTITVAANVTVDQVVVEAGGQVTIGSGNTLTIANGTGIDMSVSGTLLTNSTSGTSGISISSGATLAFLSGGTYQHNVNGEGIPTATWDAASTCLVTGVVANYPTFDASVTLGNLTWNCTSQTAVGPITANSPPTIAGNLTVQSTGSGSLRFQYGPINITGNLVMTGGKLWIAGNTGKDMNVGGNVNISGDSLQLSGVSSQGRLYVAGNLSHTGGVIAATGSGSGWHNEIIFNGTSDQTLTTTGGTITPKVNFTTNKTSGALILGSNVTLPDTLKLTSGNISTGSNTLTIASTGLVLRTSGHVIGNLAKVYSAVGSKTLEVGTANGYSPVTVNATAGTGTFTVKATQGAHPNASGTDVLQRYWTLTSAGITAANLTFNYLASDVGTGQEVNYELARYDGSWHFTGTFVNTSTHSVSLSGVSTFSDWTCGIAGALPIQMASFVANVARNSDVEVAWKTVSETNNYGFEIYRKRGDTGEWAKIGFVQGHGTTLAAQSYAYVDEGLGFGRYYYRIKQVDLDGRSETFPEMLVTVGASPDKFVLAQNYPNPFNPSTLIEFVVPENGFATMKVYNVLGQEVALLFEGNAEAGKINTARFNASNLPSGMYFYTLRSAGKVETKRMLLMK